MVDPKCGDTFGPYKCTLRKGHGGSHAGKAQDGSWAGWSNPEHIGSWQERYRLDNEAIDEAIRQNKENS